MPIATNKEMNTFVTSSNLSGDIKVDCGWLVQSHLMDKNPTRHLVWWFSPESGVLLGKSG